MRSNSKKHPRPSASPSVLALTRELHAFFNVLSLREDVTLASKTIGWGLRGANIRAVQKAGLPLDLVALATAISEAECVWEFTADKKKGRKAGSAGGRLSLPFYFYSRWQKPDSSYAFPRGSRFVIVDTPVNEGQGYALERAPGQPVEYVFALAGEEGSPFAIAPTFEGYLRKGLARGFARYWQTDSDESKRVARQLAKKASLRPTVEAKVLSARKVSRQELRARVLKDILPIVRAKSLGKMLGVRVPRGAKGDVLYAAIAEAVDALPSWSDKDISCLHGMDRGWFKYALHRAEPTPENLRRAIDVFTLGPSQPDALVELELSLKPLVRVRSCNPTNAGFFMQVLAGRARSPIRKRLGETEFWDTTSQYGQDALEHSRIVPIVNLSFSQKVFKGPVKLVIDAAAARGIAAGDKWKASAILD
ncbi:hypothetical protein KYC5002_24305 [Archangium violaceum]|uniref:hypothetical protein n=1 Tax=Archangium violaceum TaxID=83451 RepID=UPI002B2F5A45|nr:hypothetical protein KYC5002_24305 [Archangium gephyra]